ncbi:Protein kinase domain-containing protein [Fusarium keratoplasticum]|nr:Protein kinase domain-containing protein [Fusarium keratoplasticum]
MADNEITLVDLVRDSKIETRPLDSHVVEHVLYETGRSARRRRVSKTERWTKGRQLGQGTFGTVHLQTCRDGGGNKLRAVKEVKKFVIVGQELDYTRELEAIMKFSNDKYNHCFVSSQGWYELEDAICITMEYFELGDLQQYIDTPLRESEGKEITDQILEGLAFMHENGFIHRDLKPANIMVVDKSPEWFVKIADFGISKRRHHDTSLLTMQRGTLGFAAPEVIGSTSDQSYTYSADMWSLGAMVYRILTSQMAFDSIGDLFKFVHDDLEFPVGPLGLCNVSQRGQDFVLMLMESCPGFRGSAASARNHPWLIEPLTPTKGEDFHRPEADNTEMVRNTDLSVPSKAWSSDEEPRLFPSRKAKTSLKTLPSARYHALQSPSIDLTMSISQEKGHSSNAHPPEPDSTAKPEIKDSSDAQFEGPVNNAPARSALKSYPSFERPVWQSSHYMDEYEYQDSYECTDDENSVSSIYPSSSASRPANHQSKSKSRRAATRLNICRLCKLEPHPALVKSTPREALSCGHFTWMLFFVAKALLLMRICYDPSSLIGILVLAGKVTGILPDLQAGGAQKDI